MSPRPTTRSILALSALVLGLIAGAVTVVAAPPAAAAADVYVDIAERAAGGRWLLRSDGAVEGVGGAPTFGDVRHMRLNGAPLDIAGTPSGGGYWIMGADGGIFSFGDARFYGSTGAMRLNQPIVGMAPTSTGRGYWLVASDGGIFSFGDAKFYGSTGAMRLNRPIVGMAPTSTGRGYWLVASDGGIFSFGDARFWGSTGAMRLNQPIIGIAPTKADDGYWLVASDGGIFTFGRAAYYGSGVNRGSSATGVVPTSRGYAQLLATGQVLDFPGDETRPPRRPPVTGPHSFLFRPSDTLPPARWDSCRPVRIEVNYAGSARHARARETLQQAVELARAATGLDIRIVGETTATRPSAHADAIITWSTRQSEGGIFPSGVLGYGGGSYVTRPVPRITYGTIVFNGSVPLTGGIGGSNNFGVLALHELGHMLGLGHVSDTAQVMYPVIRSHPGYGHGDREGLWWLGAEQGCAAGAVSTFSTMSAEEPIPFGYWD